jgi:hypothetical protein
MRTVYTTIDPKLVALIEMALRDAGIECRLDNANAAFLDLGGSNPAIPVGFLVRDEDEVRARRTIDSALRRMGEKTPRRKAQ